MALQSFCVLVPWFLSITSHKLLNHLKLSIVLLRGDAQTSNFTGTYEFSSIAAQTCLGAEDPGLGGC